MFPITNGLKQAAALSPLLFNFVVEYANEEVQVHQKGLKLNDTHHFLVYADDVNILGGSVHTIKKNADALTVASTESGLGINADKTKYMVMCRDQNAGESHNMKTKNKSYERPKQLKNVGTTTRNQNSTQEKLRTDCS